MLLFIQSGGVLARVSVQGEVQICPWPNWCHCHPLSLALVKSRLVYLSGTGSPRVVPDKGPLNGYCCCCCSSYKAEIVACHGKDGTLLLYGKRKKQHHTHIGNFVCGTSVCQMKLLQVRVFSNRFSNLTETLHGNILPQHSIKCRYQPEIQCNGKLSADTWDIFQVAQVRQHQMFIICENLSGLL